MVRVESITYKGVVFRRYPDSRQKAHRRYYKPGGQHITRGVQALHQEVYKDNFGPIPPGHQIHHKDGDYSNNAPENLVCLSRGRHYSEHLDATIAYARSEEQREHLQRIRPKAAQWHRSPEGRAWHKEHRRKQLERQRAEKA
jgi:hypothetical protein